MPLTRRLYYSDSYLTKLQSQIVAASEDRLRVALDQTIFYPTSGGQPHDLGTFNNIPVLDVIDEGETITHVLAAPLHDAVVQIEISWARRYHHMQQHTGQHLLSAVFEQLFHIPTLSFRMAEPLSTIELGVRELTPDQLESVTLRATELARLNPSIAITFEEADAAEGLRKASQRSGTLRIVEIPGVDRSACGGTHVATLAEVLPLQIRAQDKVRGHIRIAFVCGNRAILQAHADLRLLAQIAQSLATSPEQAASHLAALQLRLAEAEKQNRRLETEAASRAGLDLYLATTPGPDGIRRALAAESCLDEKARTKAKNFAAQPQAILLMHSGDQLLLACSPDSGIHAGALLKQVFAQSGARGGGSATLAQGHAPNPSILQELMQILRLSS